MDKDRTKGIGKQLKGSAEIAVGKMTGDAKMKVQGQADKAAGKVQNAVGGAKDALRNR